jgi:hypothetical protein
MRRLSLLAILCLFAGTACWPFSGEDALAAMTLRKENDGRVEIMRAGDVIKVGDSDQSVEPGDVIRTFDGGIAQVKLEGERIAWVGGTNQTIKGAAEGQMRIIDTMSVQSDTGTVMADAKESMDVLFGDATVTADNALFRVDRRAGSGRAASYSGTVKLSAPGEANITLQRLFEAPSSASDLRNPQPYSLDPKDPFDSRELRDVIELEENIAPRSAGFASQLGREKPNLDFFRTLAGDTNVNAMKPYMGEPAIDLLLGFTVAINAHELSFADAVEQAFTLHDDGGTWGVIAAILRSDPELLLASIDAIIDASGVAADGSGGEADFSQLAAEQAQGGGGPAPSDPSDPDPAPPPGGGGQKPPPKDGDPDEPEDCANTTECKVQEIRDEVLPSPAPTDEPPVKARDL